MPGVGGDVHLGSRRHTRMCRESTWGACPAVPDWHCIPIVGDGYKVKAADPRFRPDTNIGGWRCGVQVSHFQEVSGRWDVLLFPETAEPMLDMPLSRSGDDLYSYCIDHYTPADPRRHLGCVAEQALIEVNAVSAAALLRLAVRGKEEQSNEALDEDDFDCSGVTPVPFMLAHASISLDGAPVTDVEAFSIHVDNHVVRGPNSHGHTAYLIAGRRSLALELTKLDNSDQFNDAIRGGAALSFEAAFSHPNGCCLTIELPVLYVEQSPEDGSPERVSRATPRMVAALNDDGDDVIWSVTAATTTTTVA